MFSVFLKNLEDGYSRIF